MTTKYEVVKQQFSEQEVADLTIVATVINAWNRLAIASRAPAGSYNRVRTPVELTTGPTRHFEKTGGNLMLKEVRWLACAGVVMCAAGCYRSHTITAIPHSAGHTWTGTGRITMSPQTPFAIGLAGREMFWSPDLTRTATITPSLYPAGEDYVLTGIAQTSAVEWHYKTWVHAQPVGGDNELSLFMTEDPQMTAGYNRVAPIGGTGIIEGGANYAITKICDIAGTDNTLDVHGRLYLSIIACRGTDCAGGLVEAATEESVPRQWWVRDGQATLSGPRGHFAPECMPMATTGRDGLATQYIALASPSSNELFVYRADAINAGPVASVALHAGYRPLDVVFARANETAVYVTVLRKSPTDTVLDAYVLVDGRLSPILSQGVAPTMQFVESPGFLPASPMRDLFVYGPDEVDRRVIDLSGDRP